MPNLDYDPQNPTDLLGRPIAEGDYVAWGTTYGQSAALCIAVIEKINFTWQPPGKYKNMACAQHLAERYTLRLRPVRSTGSMSWIDTETGKESWRISDKTALQDPERYTGKVKTVQHVKNVVRLDKADIEAALAELTEQARREV